MKIIQHALFVGDLDKTATKFFETMQGAQRPVAPPIAAPAVQSSPWYSMILDYFKGTPEAQAVIPRQVEPPPAPKPHRSMNQIGTDFFQKFKK